MLGSLLETISGLDAARAARQFRRAVIDFAFAGAALLLGLGFLVAAAFIFTANRYGALYTSFGFGIGFIVLSGLILVFHRALTQARARKRREEERSTQMKSLMSAAAIAAVPALIRTGGLGSLVLPVAGLIAYAIYQENARAADDDIGDDPVD